MTEPNLLRTWFREFLHLHGAATEESATTIEAVLPATVTARTGWEELERFSFGPTSEAPDPRGTRLVSYLSGVLDTVKPLVEACGFASELFVPVGHLKREGFDSALAERFAFVNGVGRLQSVQESVVPYLLIHFKATAVSDEKREGLIAVALNLRTGAWVDDLIPLIERRITEEGGSGCGSADAPDPTAWADRLTVAVRHKARAAFADFEKSLSRRLTRDVQRLTDYYTAIAHEIEKKIQRRHLVAAEAARERAKIEAIRRELSAKLAEQRTRYATTIRLEPVGVLTIRIPVMLLHLTLLRRKRSRDVVWTYNPVTKQIEQPSCESCGHPTRQIVLCDERLHLLCPGCIAAHPGTCASPTGKR